MPLIAALRARGARVGFILLAGILAGANQPARAQGSTNAERPIGLYQCQERIQIGGASPAILLEGDFTILTDTLLVNATPGPCRYDQRTTGVGRMMYQCADVLLTFDRKDPLRHPEYTVSAVVSQPVRTCSAQRADGSCARYVTENVERTVRRSGILHPVKVPATRP